MINLRLLSFPVINGNKDKTIEMLYAEAKQQGMTQWGEPMESKNYCPYVKRYEPVISLLAWIKTVE